MASAVENIFDDSDSDSGDDFVGFSCEEAQQHLDRLNAMELEIDLEEEEDEEESDNDDEQPGESFITGIRMKVKFPSLILPSMLAQSNRCHETPHRFNSSCCSLQVR